MYNFWTHFWTHFWLILFDIKYLCVLGNVLRFTRGKNKYRLYISAGMLLIYFNAVSCIMSVLKYFGGR